jgi:hypothetical protein
MSLDCNWKFSDATPVRLILFLLLAVAAQAADFQEIFSNGADVWKLTASQFMETQRANGFRWQSTSKTDLARSADESLRFADMRVWEAKASFNNTVLRELTLSLYNRGDAGTLLQSEFEKLLADIEKKLSEWSGSKPIRLRDQDRTTTIVVSREAWIKGAHRLDLTWSFTPPHTVKGLPMPFRPEFIRLDITKFDPANAPRAGFQATTTAAKKYVSALDFRARVKREPTGDTWIPDIPMVNQGKKGYCAAAVVERIVRYFGRDMDQHEIAQMADTATQGGTTSQGMASALQRMTNELRLQLTTHMLFNIAEFQKLITDYNRTAKSARKTEIVLPHHGTINVADIYADMDSALLKQARLRRDAKMTSFKATITKYVNAGCPLVWTLMVGKVPEKPALTETGGHMRLIIGFNERQNEIIYSDTWGPGHERKRMPLADAWTITFDLFTIEPRDVRF